MKTISILVVFFLMAVSAMGAGVSLTGFGNGVWYGSTSGNGYSSIDVLNTAGGDVTVPYGDAMFISADAASIACLNDGSGVLSSGVLWVRADNGGHRDWFYTPAGMDLDGGEDLTVTGEFTSSTLNLPGLGLSGFMSAVSSTLGFDAGAFDSVLEIVVVALAAVGVAITGVIEFFAVLKVLKWLRVHEGR
jgi:hypothetical protein